ncbi:MAG: aminotransferase class I/II-fold pyridoxal phosphate-dependent enzyme, partial [Flavobacteriaceae bacterium]|nr:aminotransferase class I/II-fold pyridoxal phosphate-dependent enzyme [Flavobacteriaceae bacterium]
MKEENLGLNTICTHTGELEDASFKGAVSPLYMSTSYAFENVDIKRYPRYFNTPNQEALSRKIAALEKTEAALIFGSGMAAISTAMLAYLKSGDHIVLQEMLYGGTYNLVTEQFERYGISYTFVAGSDVAAFEAAITPDTKVIYIETPSNPLLSITDMKAIAALAKKYKLVSMIDNTFASPVNQNPVEFGIDIVLHSATKYMGGHSDILAGAVACSEDLMKPINLMGRNLGGNLSDYTVWLLERSLKTMGIRVRAQNENAMKMAEYLSTHKAVKAVLYPGLKTHPDHLLATKQMRGFGGMLSFDLVQGCDPEQFRESLKLVKPSM